MKVFSNGCGVDSIAALVLSVRNEIDYPVHVFANVGDDSEHPDTLAYLHEYAIPYARGNGIRFEVARTIRRGGRVDTLYQATLRRQGSMVLPVWMDSGGTLRRSCTTDWKIRVIERWGPVRGVGIALEESHRMRNDRGAEYPLVDLRLRRSDCVDIIQDAGLPAPPKSACWFCPFQRMSRWRELRDNHPALFERACELEQTLTRRSYTLGRDERYLSYEGAKRRRFLADAVGSDVQMKLDLPEHSCAPFACTGG